MKSDLIAFLFPPQLWGKEGNDLCQFPKLLYQSVKKSSLVPNPYNSEVNLTISRAQRVKVWLCCLGQPPLECNSEDRMRQRLGTWGDMGIN